MPVYDRITGIQTLFYQQPGVDSNIGTGSGAQSQLVTRRGTNRIHGKINAYHRDTSTVANAWFNHLNGLPRRPLMQNQFGSHSLVACGTFKSIKTNHQHPTLDAYIDDRLSQSAAGYSSITGLPIYQVEFGGKATTGRTCIQLAKKDFATRISFTHSATPIPSSTAAPVSSMTAP